MTKEVTMSEVDATHGDPLRKAVVKIATERVHNFWIPFIQRANTALSESDVLLMQNVLCDPHAFGCLNRENILRGVSDLDHAGETSSVPERVDRAIVGSAERLEAYLRLMRDSSDAASVNDVFATAGYIGGVFVPAAIRLQRYELAVWAVEGLVTLYTSQRFETVPGGGSTELGEGTRYILLHPILDRLACAFAGLEAAAADKV
jgi:hypothetical protein